MISSANKAFTEFPFSPFLLAEYTTENPKIVMKCSHHFHLGCIYEWMERSDNCPVCGKVMSDPCQYISFNSYFSTTIAHVRDSFLSSLHYLSECKH